MDRQYSIEDFIRIVETLRSEEGCSWDRVQTHASLKPCMMEEAAELVASIRIYDKTGDAENMREELGDILLQVVMHSQIAKEEGLFTLEDVIDEISRKMIRRHPHVFVRSEAKDEESIRSSWEEIKKKEKEGKAWIESPLREIPMELPALTRASKVLKKADKLYGAGDDYASNVSALEDAVKKIAEFQPEKENNEAEKVIGDMLINICDIAGRFKASGEQILTDRIEDIIDKYEPREKP
ncbi:tetrapyrrole methylase family protein/MazG family protein [Kineothrix alysoides]|uniref:Tetrapyrrole methylase family protein/MazG family protein n=1 Tax=Kineothrix alysoides TaxID=1469948 RepID=A0A4R1QKD9_9FIRM|nr:MazG family protein [Kineothrix alysoides]TCL54129.1 tetrapyrrole methylase family protein/MazG family protein [Kineothrix alysoides]